MEHTVSPKRVELLKKKQALKPGSLSVQEQASIGGTTPTPTPTRVPLAEDQLTNVQKFQEFKAKVQVGREAASIPPPPSDVTPVSRLRGEVTPELQGRIEQRNVARQALQTFLSQAPEETATQTLQRLREEKGLTGLIQTRTDTVAEINRTNQLLAKIEPDIRARSEAEGAAEGFIRRQAAAERIQLTPQLRQLTSQLTSVNVSIADVESEISAFVKASDKDFEAQRKRLEGFVKASALTQDEQNQITSQLTDARNIQKNFQKGIDAIRSFALKEGIITAKFQSVVEEAQRRVDAGEDPNVVLAGVSAAVADNPQLQAKLQAELARKQKLAGISGQPGVTKKDEEVLLSAFLDRPSEDIDEAVSLINSSGDSVDVITSQLTESGFDINDPKIQEALNSKRKTGELGVGGVASIVSSIITPLLGQTKIAQDIDKVKSAIEKGEAVTESVKEKASSFLFDALIKGITKQF